MTSFLDVPGVKNGAALDAAVTAKINDGASATATALNATYAPVNAVEKIDPAGTHTPATFAVRLDANGDVDALVLNGVDL